MVHRNQDIVFVPHLIISISVWLLYDLDGFKLKQLLFSYVSNKWLFTNKWVYLKKCVSNTVIPWILSFTQDISIDIWFKIGKNESCLLFIFRVCHAFLSVHCSLVVTCWERAVLLALLYVMYYCVVSFSLAVSWVRCGTWLYRFLIFAPLTNLKEVWSNARYIFSCISTISSPSCLNDQESNRE